MHPFKPLAAGFIALSMPAAAHADDIFGNWARDDGAAHVRVAPCGDAICATNIWIKDPVRQGEKVGDRLVFKIRQTNDQWTGTAYDPQRKISLSAKLKATGSRMVSSGCVLGGVICKRTSWSRI